MITLNTSIPISFKLTASRVDISSHLFAKRRAYAVRVQEVEKLFDGVIRRRAETSFDDGIKRNQVNVG